MVLAMDQLRPIFNAVEGVDFGPTAPGELIPAGISGNLARFPIAEYKLLLKKFLTQYITTRDGSWPGPIEGVVSLWEDASYAGTRQHQNPLATREPYNFFSLGGAFSPSVATGNVFDFDSFYAPGSETEEMPEGACPFIISPEDGVREPAQLTEFATGFLSVFLNLNSPAIVESRWEEATFVWLPFGYQVFAVHIYDYTCNPSGVRGTTGGGPFISHNILGIDYTGGGGGFAEPPVDSFPIGDGTTSLFVWGATGQRLTLDSIETRQGLDD